MRFYNREEELRVLHRLIAAKQPTFIVVRGLRRIGKTRLILKSLEGKDHAYIFVPKDETVTGFLDYISRDLSIPRFSTLYDFFSFIFEKYDYIFFDEFQNFYHVDKSAYSYLQKLFDAKKRKSVKLCLLVSGSSHSLMQKIFSDYSRALYGRKDLELSIHEFSIHTVWEILDDLGVHKAEDKIQFWSIFGGIPKYYEFLEAYKPRSFASFMDTFLLHNYTTLLHEGKAVLVGEFGGEHKTYYAVLEAIAEGKTILSEIAGKFSNDINQANRYVDMMRKEYQLIARIHPVVKKKKAQYFIKSNFLSFWFVFVQRYRSYYERGDLRSVTSFFKDSFPLFMGKQFEKFCTAFVRSHMHLFFPADRLGKQWGKISGAEPGNNQYEIDICAIHEKSSKVLFGECKWKEDIDAEKLLLSLRNKASSVLWRKGERKEYYVLFAKSFKKRSSAKDVLCFDLKDLSMEIQQRRTN
jgi:uncharacterized protein